MRASERPPVQNSRRAPGELPRGGGRVAEDSGCQCWKQQLPVYWSRLLALPHLRCLASLYRCHSGADQGDVRGLRSCCRPPCWLLKSVTLSDSSTVRSLLRPAHRAPARWEAGTLCRRQGCCSPAGQGGQHQTHAGLGLCASSL